MADEAVTPSLDRHVHRFNQLALVLTLIGIMVLASGADRRAAVACAAAALVEGIASMGSRLLPGMPPWSVRRQAVVAFIVVVNAMILITSVMW